MLVQRFMDGCGFRLNFRVRNRVAVIRNIKIARKPGNQRVFGGYADRRDRRAGGNFAARSRKAADDGAGSLDRYRALKETAG